jgi:hypothetical protein
MKSGAASYFAKIPNTAIFILGKEIIAFFVDAEGNWVSSGSWHLNLFLILFMRLAVEAKG